MGNNKYRLPKDFWYKWKESLLSGKYKQGRHCLYDENKDRFCVLGVACMAAGHRKSSLLRQYSPKWVTKKPRVPKEIINISDRTLGREVQRMNDNGISFEKIIKWVETNVELY